MKSRSRISCWAWINYKEIQCGVAEAVAPLIKQVKGSHSLKGFYLLTCENGSSLQLEIALCSIGWDCLVKWVREGSKNSCEFMCVRGCLLLHVAATTRGKV